MTTEHPDEGTIHAWLDDALDSAESARISAHVASCAACQAAVAEARGLIAGATRVVRSLDADDAPAVPAGQGAGWGAPPAVAAPAGRSLWRTLRVTPARAAIAATLLLVAGTVLTRDWIARESIAPAIAIRTPDSSTRDPLLDSAIRRNIEQAVPPRALDRAPGPDVLAAKPPVPSPMEVDRSSALRVAEGRRAERALADSAPVAADVAGTRVSAKAALNVASAAPAAAPAPSAQVPVRADVAVAPPAAAPGGGTCVRLEGTTPGATLGSAALPLVVALEGTEAQGTARVAGAGDMTGSWAKPTPDSLRLALRSPAWSGTVQLALAGDTMAGTMLSAAAPPPERVAAPTMARQRVARSAAGAAGAVAPVAIGVRGRVVACQ